MSDNKFLNDFILIVSTLNFFVPFVSGKCSFFSWFGETQQKDLAEFGDEVK